MVRCQRIPSKKQERLEQREREETSEIRMSHVYENTHLVQNIFESYVAMSSKEDRRLKVSPLNFEQVAIFPIKQTREHMKSGSHVSDKVLDES
jgi:hypothetical protein